MHPDEADTQTLVATALSEGRNDILARLESRLRAAGNPLGTDPRLWSEFRAQAGRAISHCAERVRADGAIPPAAAPVGNAGAAAGLTLSTLVLDTLEHSVGSAANRPLLTAFRALCDNVAGTIPATDPSPPPPAAAEPAGTQPAGTQPGGAQPAGVVAGLPGWEQVRAAQQAERRRSAREIHDRIGNRLSLAVRYLDLYEIYRERDPGMAETKIADVRTVLNDLLDGTRRLMSDLRLETPVRSLGAALQEFVAAVDPSVAVRIDVRGDDELIPADHRDELFVVIREALRNVFAHARAHSASVVVAIAAGQVTAAVDDDGTGLDLLRGVPAERHTGLDSMRERIESLGGVWTISGRRPQGTRVEITIPLSRSG